MGVARAGSDRIVVTVQAAQGHRVSAIAGMGPAAQLDRVSMTTTRAIGVQVSGLLVAQLVRAQLVRDRRSELNGGLGPRAHGGLVVKRIAPVPTPPPAQQAILGGHLARPGPSPRQPFLGRDPVA